MGYPRRVIGCAQSAVRLAARGELSVLRGWGSNPHMATKDAAMVSRKILEQGVFGVFGLHETAAS